MNKYKLGSEKTGRNIFKPCHIAEAKEDRRHKGPISYLTIGKDEIFSADDSGRIMIWMINTAKRNNPEIAALNFIDLPTVGLSTLAYLMGTQQIVVGTEGSKLLQFDSALSPSLPITCRQSIDVCKADITTTCMTGLDVLLAGYSDGSVRMFIDLHRDSVFTLPAASPSEILGVFPATYPRVDKTTYKKIIMECLASLNVVDQQGKLHIYNLEDKIGPPEKTFDLIPAEDKGARPQSCQ